MTSSTSQKPYLLALPPEIQSQIISLLADSTDFKSIHSLLFSCKQLYAIALPFSVQTFCDIPRPELPKKGSVVRSRIVQFLSYVSIIKPELARHVRTIRLHDWLADHFYKGTVHIDANDLIFYKQLILKILPEKLGYDTHWSSRWIWALEAGIEDAAVALLLAVCTKVKNLTYGHPGDQNCFSTILIAAYGGCGRRRVKLPPSQLLTRLKNVKHESYNREEGYNQFYDHANRLFSIPSIHSYECVGARNPEMDEFDLDPMDEGCSNIQSIILRDSWCYPGVEFEATARDIMESPLPHEDTLDYLHIDLTEAVRTRYGPPGPRERLYMGAELRQMHKLKSLILGSQNVSGLLGNGKVIYYTQDASMEAPKVVECIPEHLEYLEIHSCGRNIVSQLEEFLGTLIHPDRFPNLS
ncbi:hypothetical protein DER44DRAFT_860914 [Fusarium oxysporum]|nr:hypothetical protein DER44DRAFT_860914 [Fusarium oxysporum]